jgi:hypothetical protein
MTKRTLGFLALVVVSGALVAVLFPVLAMVGLGLVALALPVAVVLVPLAVLGGFIYLLDAPRAADAAPRASLHTPSLNATAS